MNKSTDWRGHLGFIPHLKIMARRLTPEKKKSQAIQRAIIEASKSIKNEVTT